MKKIYLLLAVVSTLVAWGLITYQGNLDRDEASNESTASVVSTQVNTDSNFDTEQQNDQLAYLIEEEKLAHDIYTKMYELYGEKVFGNILQSESTHQDHVLALLNARNLPDPRSTEIGVFTNTELQKLYDDLLEKGSLSEKDAYEVGLAIEEKDIKDISTILGVYSDDDIVTALESLRSGSENHLRAFNKNLKKV